ncbi:MAG: hypothetical protein WCT85_06255, partial [Parachlamydiales bacterium]
MSANSIVSNKGSDSPLLLLFGKHTDKPQVTIDFVNSFVTKLNGYCVVPECIIKGWLVGLRTECDELYDQGELDRLKKDIKLIFKKIVPDSTDARIAYITATAISSEKPEKIEQLTKSTKKVFYICPEAFFSRMYNTFIPDRDNLSESDSDKDEKDELKKISAKWSPASYGITHLVLASLIEKKMPFYFESTSTSTLTKNSFLFYKKHGYSIHLVHTTMPTAVLCEVFRRKTSQLPDQQTLEDVK